MKKIELKNHSYMKILSICFLMLFAINIKHNITFAAPVKGSYNDGDELNYVKSDNMSSLLKIIDRPSVVGNINKKYNGDSLLLIATRKGNYNTVKVLLSRNADPNMQDLGGATPLHIAVRKNNKSLVHLLLSSKKANINMQDNEGYTPLMRAVEIGLPDIVSLLVQNKADKMVKNMYGMSSYDLVLNINSKPTQEVVKGSLG
jgi:ankyrin repeat protein